VTDISIPRIFQTDIRNGNTWLIDPPEAPYGRGCPNCGDMKVIYAFYGDGNTFKYPPGLGKPAHFIDGQWRTGETRGLPCPVCAEHKEADFLQRNCGLAGVDLDIRLASFDPLSGKEDALHMAQGILSQVPNPAGMITYFGGYGRGKTHLLKALVNGFRVAGVYATYRKLSDLLAEVREGYDDKASEAAEDILTRYKSLRVLAVDEVDRVSWTPWSREATFRLLDRRYEMQRLTLTILATNADPAKMPSDLEYLGSRMQAGIICEVGGIDMRPAVGIMAERELLEYAP